MPSIKLKEEALQDLVLAEIVGILVEAVALCRLIRSGWLTPRPGWTKPHS